MLTLKIVPKVEGSIYASEISKGWCEFEKEESQKCEVCESVVKQLGLQCVRLLEVVS
jgi:hypothetical protein